MDGDHSFRQAIWSAGLSSKSSHSGTVPLRDVDDQDDHFDYPKYINIAVYIVKFMAICLVTILVRRPQPETKIKLVVADFMEKPTGEEDFEMEIPVEPKKRKAQQPLECTIL